MFILIYVECNYCLFCDYIITLLYYLRILQPAVIKSKYNFFPVCWTFNIVRESNLGFIEIYMTKIGRSNLQLFPLTKKVFNLKEY